MKAQVTVFIIIGVLVLIAFGITLYAVGKTSSVTNQPKQLEALGAQPVKEFVDTCLNLAVADAFHKMGKQGGLLYKEQGGIHQPSNFVEFENVKVPFLIVPPEGNVGSLFFSQPPKYPFETFPYAGKKLLFKGYYGQSRLPPLYNQTPEGVYVPGSVQESIEEFIAEQTVACADWSAFQDRGYTVSAGDAKASLLFAVSQEQFKGEKYVSVLLKWPVSITTPGGDKYIESEFAHRVNVRLATLYYFVKETIDSDVTDISFIPEAKGSFSISRIDGAGFSLFKVADAESVAGGKPVEFWVARMNRVPALWQINTSVLDDVTFHVTKEGRGAKITVRDNILRFEDPCQEPGIQNPFLLELNASDPDEDVVSFFVDGVNSDNEIPAKAVEQPFSIVVGVKDQNEGNVFDSQRIDLEVALCEVR